LPELNLYKLELEARGHTVTSRWLNGNHQVDDKGLSAEADPKDRERFAVEDLEDILKADCLIHFTEQPRTPTRGGRHVEMGIALGLGIKTIVIGPREHVFCCLPKVLVYPTFDDMLGTFK
jgi:hypothetical protein